MSGWEYRFVTKDWTTCLGGGLVARFGLAFTDQSAVARSSGGALPALARRPIDRDKAKQNVTAISVFLFMAENSLGSYIQRRRRGFAFTAPDAGYIGSPWRTGSSFISR